MCSCLPATHNLSRKIIWSTRSMIHCRPSSVLSRVFWPLEPCSKVRLHRWIRHPYTDNIAGVGVGDADASATSALFLSILQESMGRIATILFAHRLGTSLEPECKMYRLLVGFQILKHCHPFEIKADINITGRHLQ